MRGDQGTIRVLWAVLVASILIPSSLFGVAVWQGREQALREAERTAERSALAIQGHAQNVFNILRLTMDRVDDRVGTMSRDEVARSRNMHDFLRHLADALPQIGTITIVDAQGVRVSSSSEFPATQVNVSDRDYMKAFRDGQRDLFVGETVSGRRTGQIQVVVARPRLTPNASLGGAIVISVPPAYFADFYRRTTPNVDHSASLIRRDGVFIVRDAVAKPSTEQPRASENFMRAILQGDEATWRGVSAVDGVQRVTAMRKLDGELPLYAVFALGTDAVLAHWREQVISFGLLAVPAMLALVAMSALAIARTRRAQVAAAQLQIEMERRERAEAQLLHAQKLEALGSLTAGIAHDFNNILQVVVGNLDMLRRAAENRRTRLIDNALHAAEQGRRITDQLLAFGRRQSLAPVAVDLNGLIRASENMLTQSLRGDIGLVLDLQPELGSVLTDPNQLQIALINLAVNARDAMPGGGSLTIRTEKAALVGNENTERVVITVSDDGVGIPADILERVFEPFFTTKQVGKGTGLGLAQVYGFVQQSGGSVEIKSAPSRGTSVILTLPRTGAEPKADAQAAPQDTSAPRRRLHILLVEDNEQVAEVNVALLRERGHTVRHAASAREALDVLRSTTTPDVVVSDLVMPGDLDGLGLAREVRTRWPRLAVILVSGYSDVAAQAEQAGFTLLKKPIQPAALEAAVQRAVEVSSGAAPA